MTAAATAEVLRDGDGGTEPSVRGAGAMVPLAKSKTTCHCRSRSAPTIGEDTFATMKFP